jgi:hypothetical protein
MYKIPPSQCGNIRCLRNLSHTKSFRESKLYGVKSFMHKTYYSTVTLVQWQTQNRKTTLMVMGCVSMHAEMAVHARI